MELQIELGMQVDKLDIYARLYSTHRVQHVHLYRGFQIIFEDDPNFTHPILTRTDVHDERSALEIQAAIIDHNKIGGYLRQLMMMPNRNIRIKELGTLLYSFSSLCRNTDYNEQVDYLRDLIDAIHEKIDIPEN